jgi:replication-associated recombination protein RarA
MAQTARGYDLHELLSALQKDIRRDREYEAVFWATELESFNPEALWNRLEVIASEDIGPACPIMPVIIETLRKQYDEFYEKDERRLFLTNAVAILARSKKSRVTDDLLNVVYGEIQHEDKRLPIPDYALDMHTLRGTMKRKGIDDFFTEGTKLENEAFENPYKEKAKEILVKYGPLDKLGFKVKKKEDNNQQQLANFAEPVKA